MTMINIGSTLKELNRFDEAYKIEKETLDLRKKVLGIEHPDTLTTMNNIGQTLKKLNRVDEAYKIFKEAVNVSFNVNGPTHPHTISLKQRLSEI